MSPLTIVRQYLLLLAIMGGFGIPLPAREYTYPYDPLLARDPLSTEEFLRSGRLDPNSSYEGVPLFFLVLGWFPSTENYFYKRELQLVQLLIEYGADPQARDPDTGQPAFCLAAATDRRLCQRFLQKGAAVNLIDARRRTALFYALAGRDPSGATELLQAGADPNWADEVGLTPLSLVAETPWIGNLTELLQAGAVAGSLDAMGRTALHHAAAYALPTDIQRFNACHRTPTYNLVDLTHANQAIIRLLLQHGLDVDARDQHGQTPLHVAAQEGNLGGVAVLLDADANPCLQDKDGKTAFDLARGNRRRSVVDYLAKRLQPPAQPPAPIVYAKQPVRLEDMPTALSYRVGSTSRWWLLGLAVATVGGLSLFLWRRPRNFRE